MTCLILAAGYATRLYPLTENFPKPLLEIGSSTILDRLIRDLEENAGVDKFTVISNHKFAKIFEKWAEGRPEISVADDGTETKETRLGAVRDILFAVEKQNIRMKKSGKGIFNGMMNISENTKQMDKLTVLI